MPNIFLPLDVSGRPDFGVGAFTTSEKAARVIEFLRATDYSVAELTIDNPKLLEHVSRLDTLKSLKTPEELAREAYSSANLGEPVLTEQDKAEGIG